jgi:hypothetical protein
MVKRKEAKQVMRRLERRMRRVADWRDAISYFQEVLTLATAVCNIKEANIYVTDHGEVVVPIPRADLALPFSMNPFGMRKIEPTEAGTQTLADGSTRPLVWAYDSVSNLLVIRIPPERTGNE